MDELSVAKRMDEMVRLLGWLGVGVEWLECDKRKNPAEQVDPDADTEADPDSPFFVPAAAHDRKHSWSTETPSLSLP